MTGKQEGRKTLGIRPELKLLPVGDELKRHAAYADQQDIQRENARTYRKIEAGIRVNFFFNLFIKIIHIYFSLIFYAHISRIYYFSIFIRINYINIKFIGIKLIKIKKNLIGFNS